MEEITSMESKKKEHTETSNVALNFHDFPIFNIDTSCNYMYVLSTAFLLALSYLGTFWMDLSILLQYDFILSRISDEGRLPEKSV